MTALVVLLQHNGAHMMMDGASQVLRDGKFVNGPALCKIHALPQLNCVVGSRGPYGASLGFVEVINSAGFVSFDEMRQGAADHFSRSTLADAILASQVPDAHRNVDIVVAGWSGVRPRAFCIQREEGRWVARELGAVTVAPSEPEIDEAIRAALPPHCAASPDNFDAERDLVTILEVQRKFQKTFIDGIPTIGAFAMLATVTKDLICTRIVKRWPYQSEASL
jgi:hypothetical protein